MSNNPCARPGPIGNSSSVQGISLFNPTPLVSACWSQLNIICTSRTLLPKTLALHKGVAPLWPCCVLCQSIPFKSLYPRVGGGTRSNANVLPQTVAIRADHQSLRSLQPYVVGYTLRHISLGCLLSHEPYSSCTLPTLQNDIVGVAASCQPETMVLDYILSSSPFQARRKFHARTKLCNKARGRAHSSSLHSVALSISVSLFLANNHSASASKTQSLLAAGAQDHINKKCADTLPKKTETQILGVPLPIAKQN